MKIVGKDIAAGIYEDLKHRVGELKKIGIKPHLTVILVGENPASVAYVKQKQKWGEYIGAEIKVMNYPTSITELELNKTIGELNKDKKVHAILVQRPLPEQIDEKKIELLVTPEKDIDGFHPDSAYTLPLPLAVVKILEEIYYFCHSERSESEAEESHTKKQVGGMRSLHSLRSVGMTNQTNPFKQWLKSKNISVLGKGTTGGGPIIKYLAKLDVSYTLIDSKTVNPDQTTKKADIIISAVGRPEIIKSEKIKKGVILIGAGIFRGEDGKLHGDYDEADIENKAGFYTPTPGGVGPVNVAMLMENLINAAEKQSR